MPKYEIQLKPSAIEDMDKLRRQDAGRVADGIERHLATEPERTSTSRIKRLRGVSDPDYRLRIGNYRVFYSVDPAAGRVDVLRVMHKDETQEYYQELQQ